MLSQNLSGQEEFLAFKSAQQDKVFKAFEVTHDKILRDLKTGQLDSSKVDAILEYLNYFYSVAKNNSRVL